MHNIFYDFYGANKSIFVFINHISNASILPYILKIISNFFFIGNFVIYYFGLCLYFYWKLKKNDFNQSTAKSPEDNFITIYNQLFRIGMCYTIFGFIYAALKFGINLPRPFCSLPQEAFTTILNTSQERCLSSFPSAHTGLATMVIYYLWQYAKNYQKVLMVLLLILVAISRISLAMHYPSDILYSLLIILTIIKLNDVIFRLIHKKLIKPIGTFLFQLIF